MSKHRGPFRALRGGPLTTGRVTTGFDNGPVEHGKFDENFYTKFCFSKISVERQRKPLTTDKSNSHIHRNVKIIKDFFLEFH